MSDSEPVSPPKPPAGADETPLPNPIAAPAPSAEPGGKEAPDVAAGAAPTATPASAPGASSRPAASAAEATLVLTFRGASWTEVKDGRGKVLVAQMIAGGQTRSVTGVPPLNVVIGKANEVTATFRGQPLDLAPVTRLNKAQFVVE